MTDTAITPTPPSFENKRSIVENLVQQVVEDFYRKNFALGPIRELHSILKFEKQPLNVNITDITGLEAGKVSLIGNTVRTMDTNPTVEWHGDRFVFGDRSGESFSIDIKKRFPNFTLTFVPSAAGFTVITREGQETFLNFFQTAFLLNLIFDSDYGLEAKLVT